MPTETQLQVALFSVLADRGYSYVTPNVHLFAWESDLLALTPSDYITEYEVKRTRSDFNKDRTKERHRLLLEQQASTNEHSGSVPARFFYATPPCLVDADDVPPYAGLVYVTPNGTREIASAPRLTKSKARARHKTKLAKSLMWDAWAGKKTGPS